MEPPKCFDGKIHNKDYLIEIYRTGYKDYINAVVHWCSECGAVVIDEEYDGRIKKGAIVPMQFPKILDSITK